jgi:hypothetical protein
MNVADDIQQIIHSLERVRTDLQARADTLHDDHDYSAEFPANDAENVTKAIALLNGEKKRLAEDQEIREMLIRCSGELFGLHTMLDHTADDRPCIRCKLRTDLVQLIAKKSTVPAHVPETTEAFVGALRKHWPTIFPSFFNAPQSGLLHIIAEFEENGYLMSIGGLGVHVIALYLRAHGVSFLIEYDAASATFAIRRRGW